MTGTSKKLVLRGSIALALLGLTACATTDKTTWEKQYDELSEPLLQEYSAKAAQLTGKVYNYRFSFVLSSDTGKNESFSLQTHFPSGVAELSPKDKLALSQKMDAYKGDKTLKVHVIGHTDSQPLSRGHEFADNQALSAARAENVAAYLRDYLNLPAAAITHEGHGAAQPISDNSSATGRAQNRRVEIGTSRQDSARATVASPENEPPLQPIPEDFNPWWRPIVKGQMNKDSEPLYLDMDELVLRALRHSTQMKVFSDLPLIRQTVIEEAKGKFDPHVFVETKYRHSDEPVGNDLRTGGPKRFEEDQWTLEAGINKQLYTGGEIELSQTVGRTDNNSTYFNPQEQGDARLALTFRQPLLNRAGYEYNESQVEIAQVDYRVSQDEFVRQVSSHLLEVERAYWALYMERANLLQRKKLYMEAEKIVAQLEARRSLDVLESQLAQAKATMAARHASSIRAEQAVRNAEGKILALINDPELVLNDKFEIATVQPPQLHTHNQINMENAAKAALFKRPEVTQAFKQLKAGLIRQNMTKNEMRPVLDFIAEVSWAGLRDNYDIGKAMEDQFDYGRPSYTVGLMLDIPIGNREAEARHRRRQIETRQLVSQLRTTVETILLEVQVAVREVHTSYREMLSQYQAMLAAQENLDTMQERLRASLNAFAQGEFLRNLLTAQEDLVNAEHGFLQSYVAYNMARSNLDRAQGVFLEVRQIEPREETDDNDLPVLRLEKVAAKQSARDE